MSVRCPIGAESRMCSCSAAGAVPSARAVTVSTIPLHCSSSTTATNLGEAAGVAIEMEGVKQKQRPLTAMASSSCGRAWPSAPFRAGRTAPCFRRLVVLLPPPRSDDGRRLHDYWLAEAEEGEGGRSGRAAARGRRRKTGRRAVGVEMQSTVLWSGSH
jgi:hypothetical protein